MNEEYSSNNLVEPSNKKNSALESHIEEGTSKRSKPLPFYKSSVISFVKMGICHMCKMRNKIVYQCHRNFQATSCEKKFCLDCLTLIYKENIIENLQKSDSWKCPYIRKVCRCKNCCQGRKETYSALEIDMNMSVYSNLRMRSKTLTPQMTPVVSSGFVTANTSLSPSKEQEKAENQTDEIDESMRCLIRQRFKRVVEFNGQMINKVNANYHKLSEEEIKFYNKLISTNLRVMNNMANNMVAHQSLLPED